MSEDQMSMAAIIGIVFACVVVAAVSLAITIFFILTLQKAMNRCSLENRAMQPGMIWLLLIPLFNIVWIFFVVINMAKSLGAEFTKRGIAADPEPGKTLGLAYAILAICSAIPFVGFLAGIGCLVCFIMYWVKINGFSKQLDSLAPADCVMSDGDTDSKRGEQDDYDVANQKVDDFNHKGNNASSGIYDDNVESPYSILEISEDASIEEIKTAYRKKMLQYHPDRTSGLGDKLQEVAEQEAKKINNAYDKIMKDRGQ